MDTSCPDQMAKRAYLASLNKLRAKAIHSIAPHLPIGPVLFHVFKRYGTVRNLESYKSKINKPKPKSHKWRTQIQTFNIEEVKAWVVAPSLYRKGKPYGVYNGIRFSLRRIIILFQIGFVCKHCSKEGILFRLECDNGGSYHLDLFAEDDTMMTIDHKVPKSKNGSDKVENYQCLCYTCNAEKGNLYNE